jgi:tetratricopeptide (TPR) repeat protein
LNPHKVEICKEILKKHQEKNHKIILFCDVVEAAQYYARKCDYEKAIDLYERSWAAEEDEKPRFWDALQGIATINKILGRTNEAEKTYDRILDCLKNEWGYSEDDKVYLEVAREKNAIISK